MRAVHLASGSVAIREFATPAVPPGFALLRLRLAGICNTDLELQRGYYGFEGVPGHEFVADVVEAGDAAWVGRRVVGEINLACGNCVWCERGLGRHCPQRSVLGIVKHPGAFAEYFTLPIANLHEVPESMADEVAVFTEPVAAACEILEQTEVEPGTKVAVLGDGKLGLLIAMVLRLHGAEVDLHGRHPEKMAIAAELGARPCKKGEAGGTKYPLVVDATGSEEGLAAAISLSEARGTVVMKSTVARPVSVDMASVIVPEITLLGSRCGRFEDALPLLSSGRMPVERLIQAVYPLGEASAAFAHASRKGTLKILLRP
ncbi:MAG: alcohol dehydrogenase catalytic domain-containing protein [Bryobacterales bacterium]|nr:alcohol dehydrogenase catalytic domain-containing protein [Bryobacterales bacterium]